MKDTNIIRFYRTLHFMTQTELAERSGLDQYRISRIEAGAEPFEMPTDKLRGQPCSNTVERYLRSRGAIGHVNGIPETEILRDLDLTERALRKLIQKERTNNKALICHDYDEKGYYIAATEREMKRFLRRHMGMICALSRECKAFREGLRDLGA